MRASSEILHSLPDLIVKSNLANLRRDLILIAICADSPSSAEKIVIGRASFSHQEVKETQALARIKKYYPEKLLELDEVKLVFDELSEILKKEILDQLELLKHSRTVLWATREEGCKK